MSSNFYCEECTSGDLDFLTVESEDGEQGTIAYCTECGNFWSIDGRE